MRFVTYHHDSQERVGFYSDGYVMELDAIRNVFTTTSPSSMRWGNMTDFLRDQTKTGFADAKPLWEHFTRDASVLASQGLALGASCVRIRPPVPKPPKIICLAGNYLSHVSKHREILASTNVEELKNQFREAPFCFTKFASSLVAHDNQICFPDRTDSLDYELEVGVVIGMGGKNIPASHAEKHIAGYTMVNDITDRFYMNQEGPRKRQGPNWFAMKTRDNACPCGPCIARVPDPANLRIRLWVNDELRQNSTTREMVLSFPEVISLLSEWVTLEVGDIIATGTPDGNAISRGGPFLKQGDIVRCEGEGIGCLQNQIRFEPSTYQITE